MIHFYKEQVELAVKLIDIKSKYDDIIWDFSICIIKTWKNFLH